MISDKQALREIAKKYRQPSNSKGLWAIAAIWAWLLFYGLIITLMTRNMILWQFSTALCLVVYLFCSYRIAYQFRALECLVHEGSHGTLFAKGAWNRDISLQALYAYIVWRPVQIFMLTHIIHHDKQGSKILDPDEIQNARWGLHTLHLDSGLQKSWKLFIRQLVGWQTYYYLRYCFLSFIAKAEIVVKVRAKSYVVQAWIPTIVYWSIIVTIVAITGTWLIFLLTYVIPFFVLTPIIRFYAEAPEHTGAGIEMGNYFRSARNRPGWLNSWALHPLNDAYHQPHHSLKPFVPWFNLPDAYFEMQNLPLIEMEDCTIEHMWAQECAIKNGCPRHLNKRKMVVSESPLSTLRDLSKVY